MPRRRSSPYKFLNSYGDRDRNRFFGRALETDVLLADIVVSRIVVLFAKTGTGKTSLINAGVRPALRDRGYRTYLVRVRKDPFGETRQELVKQARGRFPPSGTLTEQLRGLARNVRKPIVVFFDQFEEFFQYTASRNVTVAQDFVNTIGDIYDDPEAGIRIVFSMREEWFVEMGIFRDRIPAIFHNDSNLRLRWLSREQARLAIERPAGEGAYEPALVDALIDELAQTSAAVAPTPSPGDIEPAQLQIVCDTLWRRARNGRITLAAYKALGKGDSSGPVAQQVLDRRLVQEFENLGREELELLGALLPELRTAEGTKRVREVGDVISALMSTPTLSTDISSIRRLLDRLQREGLIDILPREGGEIVELTHDYLVVRLGELSGEIALIWPRKVLADGAKAFKRRSGLLHSSVVRDVIAAAPSLALGPLEGELLLRSALAHLADVRPILPALELSGAPIWKIFVDRVRRGNEAERARAVEILCWLDRDEASAVLRDALDDPAAAPHVIRLLGRADTVRAVWLLEAALDRPELAPQAEMALADLASTPGRPYVSEPAAGVLRATIEPQLADPAARPGVIGRIVRLDSPLSVQLLDEALGVLGPDPIAFRGLVSLTQSLDAAVSVGAGVAVSTRARAWLAAGERHAWLVDALVEYGLVASVELLTPLLDDSELGGHARSALELLAQRSDRPQVVTAATRALGGEIRASKPPPAPPERPRPERPPPGERTLPSAAELGAHFDSVLRLLANGRLVPFLGAGAGMIGAPVTDPWPSRSGPPTGAELAAHLISRFSLPGEERDLLRVAQLVEMTVGRDVLDKELHEVFARRYEPNPLHRLLARLPSHFRRRGGATQIIVTTAFDWSLERAFEEAGETVDVITVPATGFPAGSLIHRTREGRTFVVENPLEYDGLQPDEQTVILRLHGGVDPAGELWESFVITEEDFVRYATRAGGGAFLPKRLALALSELSLLFLGHSLREWNLRILLQALWGERYLDVKSWAVQLHADPLDVSFWRLRGVDILEVPLDEYVAELGRRLFEFDVGAVPA